MVKLGLKIWSTNIGYINPTQELYKKRVFDYIELYVDPRSTPEDLLNWQKISIPFCLHAPHSYSGLNPSQPTMEDGNRLLIEKVEQFRKVLSPVQVIFHSGIDGSLEETIRQLKLFKSEFPEIFKIAVIENKPKLGLKQEHCVGSSPEEIARIIQAVGMGFCLDVGHAIYYSAWKGSDWQETVRDFLHLSPKMFHLSDGDIHSQTDKHYHFGKGNFDFLRIVEMMSSETCVTIETEKNSKDDLIDFENDARYLRGLYYDYILRSSSR